jgi:hypothetical protein
MRRYFASRLDKFQQEIISKVGDVFIFYNIVLIDMLDLRIQYGRSFAIKTLALAC